MSQIDRTCAALAALLQPLTGARAHFIGVLVGTAAGVTVVKNTYVVPIVDGVERFDLLLKTEAEFVVTDEGVEVTLASNLGGTQHHEIRIDCPLRVLDGPAGLEPTAIVTELVSPATDGPEEGFLIDGGTPPALALVRVYEGHGSQVDLDFFRANMTEFPGVVIAWEGTELADANTQASLDYGAARVAGNAVLQAERFGLLICSKRMESHGVRRTELLDVVDAVTAIITNRRAVDGQVFSAPGGLIVHERLPQRLRDSGDFQDVYAALLRVSVTQSSRMNEYRSFNPWVRTRIDESIPEVNLPTDPYPLTTVFDYEFLMLSELVPDYLFEEDGQTPIFEEDGTTPITEE